MTRAHIASVPRDDHYPKLVSKTITFDGSAGNGAVGEVTLFTVTGIVVVNLIMSQCVTDLTEAAATATISLGTTTTPQAFNQNINAVDIDAGEFVGGGDTTPAGGGLTLKHHIIAAGQVNNIAVDVVCDEDIVWTIGTQNVNGGSITTYLQWTALSQDGRVVSA